MEEKEGKYQVIDSKGNTIYTTNDFSDALDYQFTLLLRNFESTINYRKRVLGMETRVERIKFLELCNQHAREQIESFFSRLYFTQLTETDFSYCKNEIKCLYKTIFVNEQEIERLKI